MVYEKKKTVRHIKYCLSERRRSVSILIQLGVKKSKHCCVVTCAIIPAVDFKKYLRITDTRPVKKRKEVQER